MEEVGLAGIVEGRAINTLRARGAVCMRVAWRGGRAGTAQAGQGRAGRAGRRRWEAWRMGRRGSRKLRGALGWGRP